MAEPTYTRELDTLATSALDYYAGRPHECIHDGGEKFLRALLERGRVMAVPHTEFIFHDVVYDHGQNTQYYALDGTGGFPTVKDGALADQAQTGLTTAPTEVLTSARFEMAAGTRNIVLEQSMPAGNRIDQIATRVKANLSKIFNEEEILFWRGMIARDTLGTDYVPRGFVTGDKAVVGGVTDAAASYGTGLTGNMIQFVTPDADNAGSPAKSITGGLSTDNVANWSIGGQDTYLADSAAVASGNTIDGTTANTLSLLDEIQGQINLCGYSEEEHTTHVWVTRKVFQYMVQAMIDKGALPDPVRADLGNPWNYKIPFGGVEICWSRYLTASSDLHFLDKTGAPAATAITPVIGLNMDTFRYNIATDAADMTAEGLPGFIKQVGPIIPMVDKTNVFKRIAFSRCISIEKGRRSSFAILNRAES
ncbi:MAG: hypothetical protein ACYTKD_28085 [Planctomycetota bacterium]|jgi:hypothetical protein